jgi:hypothetical protein
MLPADAVPFVDDQLWEHYAWADQTRYPLTLKLMACMACF